jgi:Fe2+ or Zn2+ uptake regulation protein
VPANLSTIYRNLATFCAMGWLEALPGPTGERHYHVLGGAAGRMAVRCLDCGQLTTLQTELAGPLNAVVRDLGFNAESLRVTLAAHCEHVCGRKSANN